MHSQVTTGACRPPIGDTEWSETPARSQQRNRRVSKHTHLSNSSTASNCLRHERSRSSELVHKAQPPLAAQCFGCGMSWKGQAAASSWTFRLYHSVMPNRAGMDRLVHKAEPCAWTRLNGRILVPSILSTRTDAQGVVLSSSDVRDAVVRVRKARSIPLLVWEACSIVGICFLRQPVQPIQ